MPNDRIPPISFGIWQQLTKSPFVRPLRAEPASRCRRETADFLLITSCLHQTVRV
jgi:hypothetical protein